MFIEREAIAQTSLSWMVEREKILWGRVCVEV